MSNELIVEYEDKLHAVCQKVPSGPNVTMDAPIGCGGSGKSFTPMELFAFSYTGCVVMSMDITARQNGFNIAGARIKISVAAEKSKEPIIIKEVSMTITLPQQYSEEQMDMLHKSAHNCPIHNSLRPETKKTVTFEVAQ